MNSFIINTYKPPGITSYDVIRKFKKAFGKHFGKIGHFGTLDPFAEGVLLLGFGQAPRLNNYIHDCLPKTYLAKGILGLQTPTGDLTVEATAKDESDFLLHKIAHFELKFIEESLKEKFLGKYMQAPHKYSAAKYEGKKLHEWAREGVEIKKEKVEREVYSIEVVKYSFPNLDIRFEVSSGTYIRTLFEDCANYLGTLGTLEGLVREKIGPISTESSLKENDWPTDKNIEDSKKISPDQILDFPKIYPNEKNLRLIINGVQIDPVRNKVIEESDYKEGQLVYICDEEKNIKSLCRMESGIFKSQINFTN